MIYLTKNVQKKAKYGLFAPRKRNVSRETIKNRTEKLAQTSVAAKTGGAFCYLELTKLPICLKNILSRGIVLKNP